MNLSIYLHLFVLQKMWGKYLYHKNIWKTLHHMLHIHKNDFFSSSISFIYVFIFVRCKYEMHAVENDCQQ